MIGEHLAAIEAAVMEALTAVGSIGVAILLVHVQLRLFKRWLRSVME